MKRFDAVKMEVEVPSEIPVFGKTAMTKSVKRYLRDTKRAGQVLPGSISIVPTLSVCVSHLCRQRAKVMLIEQVSE